MTPRVFFFTEGSHQMGMGHIIRCQALGEAFMELGMNPVFYFRGDRKFMDSTPFKTIFTEWIYKIDAILQNIPPQSITIIDSYHADKEVYFQIQKNSKLSIYFDDTERILYPPGIIINGIPDKNMYRKQKKEHIFLTGPAYQPIRKDLWDIPKKNIPHDISNILIIFGGTDIRNLTPRITKILLNYKHDLTLHLIIGPGTDPLMIKEIPESENIITYHSPDFSKLLNLFYLCDIAISGAGQTLFELARIGIPTIAIKIINNQTKIISFLEKNNCLYSIGEWQNLRNEKLYNALEFLIPQKKREDLSQYCRSLIDGQGARRVVSFVKKHINYL